MLQIGTRPTLKLCIFIVISFFYRNFSDNLLKVIFTNLLLFSLENDIRENNKTKLPQTAVWETICMGQFAVHLSPWDDVTVFLRAGVCDQAIY